MQAMEKSEADKPATDDAGPLNRNRSFKSKQLVRSQAIRESQSPPRTISPSPAAQIDRPLKNNVVVKDVSNDNGERSDCSHGSDEGESRDDGKKQAVEIQITGGAWDESGDQRQRTRRWLGHKQPSSRDLLSNNPRVACVCGNCAACPHCRGRRRRHICTIKQDSGIACSDDCPDCSDSEMPGLDNLRKSDSVEIDDQGFCRCPEKKDKPKNLSLSRTDSDEKIEPTGEQLVYFIKETLNKNARDRLTMLKIEKELHMLVNDTGRCIVRFPVMTSYGRMLVHRCAALFQLSHHLDQTNKNCVLVSKSGTCGGRIPCTSFKQWCTATFPPPSPTQPAALVTHAKSILKRDTNSLDEAGIGSLANSRSKSLEQREKEYEKMKRRIFSSDNCSQDESQWPWFPCGPIKLLTPESGRNKLVKVQSLESGSQPSTSGSGSGRGRGAVSKSHSFGGYGAEPTPAAPPPRLLSRQGDLASSSWRLSPSSSGYKTLSLRSTDSVTPSPTGGASPEPGALPPLPAGAGAGAVVCAVTGLAAVPPGALVLHPQTGRPLTNPDGSLYLFDPNNLPLLYDQFAQDTKIDQNNEKKRGKLEKQNSFIDHDSEAAPPPDETRSKCCCDCRRNEVYQQKEDDKSITELKCEPTSPNNNNYEQADNSNDKQSYDIEDQKTLPDNRQYEPTNQTVAYKAPANENAPYATYDKYEANQRTPYEDATNQRTPYENSTNHRPSFEPSPNHRIVNDVTAQRMAKLSNQESQEIYYQQQYAQIIRNDEVTSPAQVHYLHQDMSLQLSLQAKTTPAPIPDPNLRPLSLTNMAYPTAIPQGYPYLNQYRMDQPIQQMYQPALPASEQKQIATHQEPTFRIDPSYPYAAVDYASQCGACVDPNTLRSYNMSYGQVDMPQAVLPQAYPVSNLVLPQSHLQHYPYQEPVQWQPPLVPLAPKIVPEVYQPVYPSMYQYSLLYPQVIPQPYPMVQPVYQTEPGRSSSSSSFRHKRDSLPENDTRPHDMHSEKIVNRRNSNEIAAKIQQIKEQMSRMNTGQHDQKQFPRDDRRRNNGAGILGSCPTGHAQNRQRMHGGRQSSDERHLSPAARAIVHSIRNIQAKSHYQDNRRDYYRPDRARRQERDDRGPVGGDGWRKDDRQYRTPYTNRQMSPNTWCRRSPGPVHPMFGHNPRRPPHPDARNARR